MSGDDYDKHDVLYHLCRVPSDKKILPLISAITGKKVLDVGLGTGYYTKHFLGKNEVSGIDQNPHLNRLPITVVKADASSFSDKIGNDKFDVVFSTWTTEYLDEVQLLDFFKESRKVIDKQGRLIMTIILPVGLGWLYIKMAKYLKGISKYFYSTENVRKMLKKTGFRNIQITDLRARAGLPWAILVTAEISG